MTPLEFKNEWFKSQLSKSDFDWCHFDENEIEGSPLNEKTKEFLRVGFPKSATPFLDFGWEVFDGKFQTVFNAYSSSELNLNPNLANYWIFGSDGAGNPICFDVSRFDEIILLDHEDLFATRIFMNSSITEIATCLLAIQKFLFQAYNEKVASDSEDSNISQMQIDELVSTFYAINESLIEPDSFWRGAINEFSEDEIG
jgi:hypothetical protein